MRVRVTEFHSGLSRSSSYYFVLEEGGRRLVHISRYARSHARKYRGVVEYEVDLDALRGKRVVEVAATNSGIICSVFVMDAEELARDPSQRRAEAMPISILNDADLEHLTWSERLFLAGEWNTYLTMIDDLKRLLPSLAARARSPYVILPQLLDCQLESGASFPLSYLIPYSREARRRSLEALLREVHQLWVATRLLGRIAEAGKLKEVELVFDQSPYRPVALFECRGGPCSLWYEFDLTPHTMCRGALWHRSPRGALKAIYDRAARVARSRGLGRVPLRPDLVVLAGAMSCNEVVEGAFSVRMVIECKNQEYGYWSGDVSKQIIPYKEIFEPEHMVVASLKPVPEPVKSYLSRQGIVVVDSVYPGGDGAAELLELASAALGI